MLGACRSCNERVGCSGSAGKTPLVTNEARERREGRRREARGAGTKGSRVPGTFSCPKEDCDRRSPPQPPFANSRLPHLSRTSRILRSFFSLPPSLSPADTPSFPVLQQEHANLNKVICRLLFYHASRSPLATFSPVLAPSCPPSLRRLLLRPDPRQSATRA